MEDGDLILIWLLKLWASECALLECTVLSRSLSMPCMYDSSSYGQQTNTFRHNQSGSKATTPSSWRNILRPWLIGLTQLLVPNGPRAHSWVLLLSVEGHVKQLLPCSVLQLSVNKEILPVCSGHQKYTAALRVQLHFYSSAVPVTGGKPPGDMECRTEGLLPFKFNPVLP